jgi:hypothetical protein
MGGFERASFCGWWVDIGTGTLGHQNSWTSFSFQMSSSVSAPEGHLKDLFDSFRLEVRYNKVASWAKCRVAINEEGLDGLVAHSAVLMESGRYPAQPPNGKRSLLIGAPGRIRTCAPRSGGVCSIP